jgi:hypothetical protein
LWESSPKCTHTCHGQFRYGHIFNVAHHLNGWLDQFFMTLPFVAIAKHQRKQTRKGDGTTSGGQVVSKVRELALGRLAH